MIGVLSYEFLTRISEQESNCSEVLGVKIIAKYG
jgi:hypothetical protein